MAFGETFVEEHSNTNRTPYLFNGKELDEETGLYYYGARYYDPKTSIFESIDRFAEKYPGLSNYSYAANNPVNYIDINGDSVDYSSMSPEDQQIAQNKINEFRKQSESFDFVMNKLENSKTIYKVNLDPSSDVNGYFNPKENSINFKSLGAIDQSSATVEEFFHAFQFDISYVYPGVGSSNREFESKLFKFLFNDEVSKSTDNPNYIPFVHETGMDNLNKDYMFEKSPLMNGAALNFSCENLSSKEFYNYYQNNLTNFVKTWRESGVKAPSYTSNPSSHGPNAIIYIRSKLGK
ncbi:RHS repeat-associated core domain-containing protein [Mangrovivirga sp. M17]|uniref:RHS repeat-associated core domain-containing protein n=1 Tax=Mangrovivirga halotolerans TaxID=2993936 RepID=A0ABT3RR09_9BACT|nr:RHS repeat-associated core domain-containing protein [Mangrovivirga halotolerans]MCX2743803.1 RHS repeat-associated core domain-containing protein [Mangrovivirga halotolerans]